MTDLKTIAGTAETVVEDVMKFEPFVAPLIPGEAAFQPFVMMAAPFVENALKALSTGNNGDLMSSFIQLLQHLMPGHPNAAILDVQQTATPPST